MKNINNNAPVRCNKIITIDAKSKKVWSVLTSINNWSTWQTEIINSKQNGELKPETTFNWKAMGGKRHSILLTVEPLREFGWTGKSIGMLTIHNWTLTGKEGETKDVVSNEWTYASVSYELSEKPKFIISSGKPHEKYYIKIGF